MPEDSFLYIIDSMVKTCKWFAMQALLFFLMPYVWNYDYSASTLLLMLLYTTFYAVHWNFAPEEKQVRRLPIPYIVYVVVAVIINYILSGWAAPLWHILLLPLCGWSMVTLWWK